VRALLVPSAMELFGPLELVVLRTASAACFGSSRSPLGQHRPRDAPCGQVAR
jgi:hypothetical protein